MNVPDKIRNAFYERQEGFGIPFFVNDPVMIQKMDQEVGERKGFVISIESTEPEWLFLIEYEKDGSSEIVGSDGIRRVSE